MDGVAIDQSENKRNIFRVAIENGNNALNVITMLNSIYLISVKKRYREQTVISQQMCRKQQPITFD